MENRVEPASDVDPTFAVGVLAQLGEMYRQKTRTDITVIVDERRFDLHACVLMCVSAYFRRLLESADDSSMRELELTEMRPRIFEQIAFACYTGVLSSIDSWSNAMELLNASKRLQIPHTEAQCTDWLNAHLSTTTQPNLPMQLKLELSLTPEQACLRALDTMERPEPQASGTGSVAEKQRESAAFGNEGGSNRMWKLVPAQGGPKRARIDASESAVGSHVSDAADLVVPRVNPTEVETTGGASDTLAVQKLPKPSRRRYSEMQAKYESSSYIGVNRPARSHRWHARIKVLGETIHLGFFDTAEEAARAYDARALQEGRTTVNFPANGSSLKYKEPVPRESCVEGVDRLRDIAASDAERERPQDPGAGEKPEKYEPSKYIGVSRQAGRPRWEARIKVNGTLVHLGTFDSAEEAARAYDARARQHNRTPINFPGEVEKGAEEVPRPVPSAWSMLMTVAGVGKYQENDVREGWGASNGTVEAFKKKW